MDPWLFVIAIVVPAVLVVYGDSLLARLSPKYAAKRQLRAEAKSKRRRQARERREERNHARMMKWALKYPNDPDAKEFLALEASSKSKPADEPVDYQAELRRSQEADDECKQKQAERKAARELRERETFEWAIKNPTIPEARRHLDEQLEAAIDRLESADSSVRHCQTMMDYMKDDLDPEFIAQSTRLAEAEAKKAIEAELVRRIQEALDVKLPEPSEQ